MPRRSSLGTITADGKMTLKLYYLADRIQLNFELGTKNPADGTYNNGAWWRGDDPSTNIYRSGEKITLPNPTAGIRPGYVLHGWYISNDGNFTDPVDGSTSVPCDLSGIVTREWINAHSNSIFPAGALSNFTMPNQETTLYAVWLAEESEYQVIVNVIQGDGTIEQIAIYDRTGMTGNYLNYTDPAHPYEQRPTDKSNYTALDPITIPAGYQYFDMWAAYQAYLARRYLLCFRRSIRTGYRIPSAAAYGYLNATGLDADAAGIDKTKLYLYLQAIPQGTDFFVEIYTVDRNGAGEFLAPNLVERNRLHAPRASTCAWMLRSLTMARQPRGSYAFWL